MSLSISHSPRHPTITQRHALVCTVEALGTIEPTSPLERPLAGLLLSAYERRYLRRCTKASPKDGPDEWGFGSRMTRNLRKTRKGVGATHCADDVP